jgi:hypothetical protein
VVKVHKVHSVLQDSKVI